MTAIRYYSLLFLNMKCVENWLVVFCGVTGVVVIALCGYGGCCRPYHSSSSGEWDITPGEPGSDYPVLTHIPPTGFQCKDRLSGYYADIDTRCQVSTSIIFLFFFFFFTSPRHSCTNYRRRSWLLLASISSVWLWYIRLETKFTCRILPLT